MPDEWTLKADLNEMIDIRRIFPKKCIYFWNGQGLPPESTILKYRCFGSLEKICKTCLKKDCQVRGC